MATFCGLQNIKSIIGLLFFLQHLCRDRTNGICYSALQCLDIRNTCSAAHFIFYITPQEIVYKGLCVLWSMERQSTLSFFRAQKPLSLLNRLNDLNSESAFPKKKKLYECFYVISAPILYKVIHIFLKLIFAMQERL